jgi:hypothetical protein
MTKKRKNQIKKELEKRLELWLSNSTFDEMSFNGSKMYFEMALGPVGLGQIDTEKLDWLNKNDFESFITIPEFESPEYEEIIEGLFDKAYKHNQINNSIKTS